ncbi:RNA exonuclease 4 isoform X2 [Sinocyclocheilus anshuiensis]|uniref:RNA exonuclease 4 isoform X1 n=1 Tax=Sinocyclocheilus anshuiensis TaxID=1608454 RepID=UPI0007B93CE7|nr:PREDICTED: RNA exonuclease 4-like isoform X1 [Sinocyclocheilus anshuiensis]XP_016306746.1 PREDICTED: RNA exonuclease 4-like isoform X2 [Sinocyclocheilus anshuiensis]
MSEVKLKKHAENVQTNGQSNHEKKKKKHENNKKTFFYDTKTVVKKKTKPTTVKPNIKPPTKVEEYSCNWKKLLQTLAANPEKKNEDTKQAKDANVKGKQLQKTVSKDSHKLHLKKPARTVRPASETSGGVEKDGDQQNGKDSARHKQFKAEKRKRKDEKEKPMNKKKKVEEVEKKTAEPDIWFDDVDPDDIEAALGPEAADIVRKRSGMLKSSAEVTEKVLVKEHGFEGLTRAVAMDCEMVGVGCDGEDSILARVSIVNHFGKCIYDKYIKPTEKVMDYRTAVSGIRPADIENGEDIKTVQKEVAQILEGRILVGHAIHNDLKILLLDHPKKMIRDTQKYKPFRQRVKSARPALRVLCKEILSVKVQQGEHSSVQDAQATMRLYTLVKKQWEAELKAARAGQFQKSPRKPKTPKNQSKLIQISR